MSYVPRRNRVRDDHRRRLYRWTQPARRWNQRHRRWKESRLCNPLWSCP